MSDELDDLRREYRSIETPAHVATRIRAEVAERPFKRHRWMPATATMMVAVATVWLLPALWQQQSVETPRPLKPSLTALASLKPDKPAAKAPSLTQIRSVRTPRMPSKPKIRRGKPQTHFQFENQELKEKDHAYT